MRGAVKSGLREEGEYEKERNSTQDIYESPNDSIIVVDSNKCGG